MTGTHDAVRFALDNIAKGAQRLTGALDAADLGRQVVEANRQLLEAQKQLDDARATARQTGLDVDRALAESWQREVDRLSGRVEDLIAQGRAEVEAVDTARAGAQAAQDERRRDTLKGIVAEIDKAGQAYENLPEKIARARAEEEHRRDTIRATLLPDGSNRAEIDAVLAASRDLEQQRIAALEKSASKTDEAREVERRRKENLREVKKVTEETWTPAEKYAATIEKLNGLLASGAIDQETYARAVSHAREEMEKGEKAALAKATDAASGVRRAINSYMEDVSTAAKVAEQAGIGEEHADLAVLDAARGAGILPRDADRRLALLEKPGLVDHRNAVSIAERLDHVAAHDVPQAIGTPRAAPEQRLDPR